MASKKPSKKKSAKPTVKPIENPAPTPEQFKKRAICMAVELAKLGTIRKVKGMVQRIDKKNGVGTQGVFTDANPDRIRVRKEILTAKTLDEIKVLYGEIRRFLDDKCLPSDFKAGIYVLPIGFVTGVDERMAAYQQKIAALAERFANEEYDQAVEEAKDDLQSLWARRDYLERAEVKNRFYLKYRYVTFTIPEELELVDPEISKRATEELREGWRQTINEARACVREAFNQLVKHLIDRLTPDDNGKAKIFHNATFENLQTFFEEFKVRDVTDDAALQREVQTMKKLLNGVEPDELRDRFNGDNGADTMRADVLKGAESVKERLDSLLIDRPTREISLFDE